MFDESCPDGLEFRSTINAKAWFILDTCTDGNLQCSDCEDMGQYSGQGNSGKHKDIVFNFASVYCQSFEKLI